MPRILKYPLIFLYILYRLILRGSPSEKITLNLAGVMPKTGEVVHGGKVKLLHLRERFGDTWKHFNIAYLASSGLPFAPAIWLHLYKLFGVKIVWNQNGVAYPAWAGEKTDHINSLMKPIHQADYVVFQTEFTKKCSDKFLGQYTGVTCVLINPVDTKKFIPSTEKQSDQFTIVMSGHHFESKERLRVSLESVRDLRQKIPNAKLLVIGNTQEIPREDWIEVVGKFSQEEAPALYQRAHMLLHLKNLDPCPTIVLEALSSGLPVVGLDNGGMPELVDKASGILVEAPENFDEFQYPTPDLVVEALIKIKDNLEEYNMGARSQALKFDKEIWLKRHQEIFQNLWRKYQ